MVPILRDFYKPDGNWWDGDHEEAHVVGRVEYLDKYDVKKGIVLGR